MGGWDAHEDDQFPDDIYLTEYPNEESLAVTSLGRYADLSRADLCDDDVLWGDIEGPALMEDLSPDDLPLAGGWGPGPFDADFGLSLRQRWSRCLSTEQGERPDVLAETHDVFGSGLSRHTWLWTEAQATLESFADEPRRIGDVAPVVVAQAAEELLAAGPPGLPSLVEAAVGFRMGDSEAVRLYVEEKLVASLSPGSAAAEDVESGGQHENPDVVANLLTRALVCADFEHVAEDVESLAAELLLRNGEAPGALTDRVAEILAVLGDVPAVAVDKALDAADDLVEDGLIPSGQRNHARAAAAAAGWLMLGAGLGCSPGSIAMLLCLPSAPRTLIRSRTRGLGPFGRYCAGDSEEVVAGWRSGGTLLVGVPGSGKTQLMIWLAAGAPGAVVASTPNVLDVFEFAARATDHDCLVFDPGGLFEDGVPPGIEVVRLDLFSLVSDWESAGTVATLMVEAAGNHHGALNEAFWRTMSALLLRIYLFAAKSGGRRLADALEWLEYGKAKEVMEILEGADDRRAAASAFASHLSLESGNTRDSIVACAIADLQAFVNLSNDGDAFDFDRFAAGSGTLVLLADPTTSVACRSAVGMLTRQLIEARFRCFRQGRAGAPMLVLADEAARTPGLAPVLSELLAIGPSRGVNIVAACQALEQFDAIPGGSREITRAAARTLIFPESMLSELLQVGTYIEHESADGGVTELDPSRLARPGESTMHVLEGSRLRSMRPFAAHQEGLWRLCRLDAAFSRAGSATIAYW